MILKLQNAVLEMIAKGEPLEATLSVLCLKVEAVIPGVTASVLKCDEAGFHTIAAPSLPEAYWAAIDGLKARPFEDSRDAAAYFEPGVIAADIATDPRWAEYKSLALPLGLKACWSGPIKTGERVVGTFAFYYPELRGPSALEQQIMDICVRLSSIAIDREERVMERQRLIYTDALTGLPNRAAFDLVLGSKSGRLLDGHGILLADIDNLKLVNDTFGHSAGDALIRVVAERIGAAAGKEQTFRLGGDEFAIVVSGQQHQGLEAQAHEILKLLALPAECAGHVVSPTATIGGALTRSGVTADQVRQNADIALYHAKEHSRGQYVGFHPGLRTALTRRIRAVRDVDLALAENRIDAFYQPIVRIDTRETVGLEALCRMTATSGEVVAAAHFHEATKDAHVAAALTRRMLTRVAADMRTWLDAGLPLQHVGINLSAVDFRTGGLRDLIRGIFGQARVPLEHLILEVTEPVYLGQRDYVVSNEIKALRADGLKVALDDFGTGYASLTHLLTVPVDIIKIDKSFVERFIIESLISIARNLGIRVVAEGIESEDQAEWLLKLGCRLGQGYLFAKAMDRAQTGLFLGTYGQPIHYDKPSRRYGHPA
jgi:diguanylate cyclase (GGDEF)-like protein